MQTRISIALPSAIALAAMLSSGCVRRTLTIRTEPQGGLVFLNGEEVGSSPVTVDFTWYGDYDVEVHKEGFTTLKTHFVTPAPWYQLPPFDFFSEVLWPGHMMDAHEAAFSLEPAQPLVRDDLIARARELQVSSRGGRSSKSDEPAAEETESTPAQDSETSSEVREPASEQDAAEEPAVPVQEAPP